MHFIHADAMKYLADHGHEYDVIHASPVCRAHTAARYSAPVKYQHHDYIPELRELLLSIGRPFTIENVEGAPLRNPITLCGMMFELPMYRHRLIEFGHVDAPKPPAHPPHRSPVAPMGRKPKCGQLWSIAGNFTGVLEAGLAMEMPWANQDGIRQAIPPRYTRWVGDHMMSQLMPKSA
jgi:DNA (cytosine-5)-methyltransferase 1